MTTEPADLGVESLSKTSATESDSGFPRADVIGSGIRDLEERLRDGALRRLQVDPPTILTAIVGGHCSAIRVRNVIAAAHLELDDARWRLSPHDCIDVGASSGRSTMKLDRWSYLYHDPDADQLIARDRLGESSVEFDLERWSDHAAPRDRAGLDHRVQQPPSRADSKFSAVELHGTAFDPDAFESAWQRCDSFGETRRLERAARMSREDLLLHLPTPIARALRPSRVTEIFSSLSRFEGPVVFELFGSGHQTRLRPRRLESRASGGVLLGIGRQTHLAVDRSRIKGAHLVELTRDGRKDRALELVDGHGRLVGRLRRPAETGPSRTLAWRAALDADGTP